MKFWIININILNIYPVFMNWTSVFCLIIQSINVVYEYKYYINFANIGSFEISSRCRICTVLNMCGG